MLIQKGTYFPKEFNRETMLSTAWLERWNKCWNEGQILKSDESGGVNLDMVKELREGVINSVLTRYQECNMFICDETGLFWQMLPKRSLVFIGGQDKGGESNIKWE